MIKEWKAKLDCDNIVGAILMDLSKAFDCIPHDLLIAKLHAYGLDENALVLIYSYLKRWKQSVRINNTYSSFQTILSGVPQGSVLGAILFNVYMNDLFFFIKQATVHNYAGDNTLAYFPKTLTGGRGKNCSDLAETKSNDCLPGKVSRTPYQEGSNRYLWREYQHPR